MIKNARIVGKNVVAGDYHGQDAKRGTIDYVMSPSSINAFARLPSRWFRGWEPPASKAKSWGDLIDCRALTPCLFEQRFAVEPEKYPCEATKKDPRTEKPWRYGANFTDSWKDAREDEGKTVVSAKSLARCDAAVKRLFEVVDGDDTVQRWFDCCDMQVHVAGEWHDEETGLVIPVQCLIDFVPRIDSEFQKCLGDFKSTRCAHPIKFQRQSFDFGWHRQAAFDLDLYRAAMPSEDRNTWAFIIQENFEPWEPNRAFYGADQDMGQPGFVELGRDASFGGYEYWLGLYCQCIKFGRWPGYNSNDETAQGWCILRPEPFMAERAAFSAKFEVEPPDETPAPEMAEDKFEVEPPDETPAPEMAEDDITP